MTRQIISEVYSTLQCTKNPKNKWLSNDHIWSAIDNRKIAQQIIFRWFYVWQFSSTVWCKICSSKWQWRQQLRTFSCHGQFTYGLLFINFIIYLIALKNLSISWRRLKDNSWNTLYSALNHTKTSDWDMSACFLFFTH